ncbi:hypothetical protein [uncultured Microbacterium sp.]|uniref:hypothetical protein n=1 Tax=uncultured Microbacterium sp. TaxID=191216 RepID=UPI0026386F58|nr:hypothetical protein [uncultured Microbacterium sp.]
MIFSFIIFLVLFLGGLLLMGYAFDIEGFEALMFCAGLTAVTLSMAWIMRERGSATRRADNWDGGPSAH